MVPESEKRNSSKRTNTENRERRNTTWYSPDRRPEERLLGGRLLCQLQPQLCFSPWVIKVLKASFYKNLVSFSDLTTVSSKQQASFHKKFFHSLNWELWDPTWRSSGSSSRCPSRRRAQRLQQCNQLGRLEKNWWQKCMFFCTFGTFKVIFVLTSKGPLPKTKCFLSGIAQIT